MQLLKLGITQVLLHMSLPYSALGLIEFQSFQRYHERSTRLTAPYRTEWNSSLVSCCILCNDDPACIAINYEKSTKRCELNGASINTESEKLDGWDVYYKEGEFYYSNRIVLVQVRGLT